MGGNALYAAPQGTPTFSVNVNTAGSLSTVKSMRVDSDGTMYFLHGNANSFSRLSSDGTSYTSMSFSTAIPNASSGLDFVITGNILFVANQASPQRISRYDLSGSTATFVASANTGSGAPALAIGPDGVVYFSRSNILAAFDSSLSSVPTSGRYISTSNTLATVARSYFSTNGNFYYTAINGSVRRLIPPGNAGQDTIVATANNGNNTPGFFVAPDGTMYTASPNSVKKWSPTGNALWNMSFGTGGVPALSAMAVDATGNIYVTNTNGDVRLYQPINPVSEFSATSASATSVTLNWTSGALDSDFGGVMIRRSSSGTPTSVSDGTLVTQNNTGSSYQDTGLEASTTYYYTIFNKTSDGFYSSGVTLSVTTAAGTPDAPVLSATLPAPNSGSVSLSWNAPALTATFLLQRSQDGGPATTVSANMDVSVTSYSDTGLNDGAYVYSLYAISASGVTSNAGVAATVNIDVTAPSPPSLEASKPTPNGTTVSLVWSTPSGAAKFALFRSKDNADPVSVSSNIPLSTTSYTDTDLTDGDYVYSIYAIDEVGNTSNAGISTTVNIDTTAPNAPSSFNATASGNAIALSWV
ncbi:MAG: hypothetical protein AB7F28_08450, partial [Candidatus Margulisiibacteriota bacterium]